MFKFVRYALLTYSLAVSGSALGTTYYVAATGLDTNSGTSKTSPWLHAPGMSGATGIPASYTPQPGDSFILHGGDTWHWSGTGNTPVGVPWTWKWSGTGSSSASGGCTGAGCIYVGVDTTWYNSSVCGSSFCRPKLTGDNPLSTSTVASCPKSTLNNGTVIWQDGASFVTWDNFEISGVCDNATSGQDAVVYLGQPLGSCYNTFQNFYIHGWTMASNYGDKVAAFYGSTTGTCSTGDTYPHTGNVFAYNILDGSDSSPQAMQGYYQDCYNVHHNYETMLAGNNCNNMHLNHDNVTEYNNEDNSNGVDHGDTWQFYGEAHSNNYFYNNVIRHSGNLAGIGINVIFEPMSGYTDVAFNNIFYDINSGNFLLVNGVNGGKIQLINNTFQTPSGGAINCANNGCVLSQNNHYITQTGSAGSQYSGAQNPTTQTADLIESVSAASAAGYTSSNQYAPTSSKSPTVQAGTSVSSICSGLTDTGAAAACIMGTNLACSYTLGSGVLVCPGQASMSRTSPPDIGAYVFNGSSLQPPTNLSATVQ